MPMIVGIRFKAANKVYYFDPLDVTFEEGEHAIVETIRGVEYGTVVIANREVNDSAIKGQLKPIIRKATEQDTARHDENIAKQPQALKTAQEKIEKHNLGMKLIGCEYTFDGAKIILYYTADGRIDFRELVKDLAGAFRIRVELRQIGKRDECKQVGGIGPCGRPCCCASHLCDFDDKVSIHMAKTQGLSLNPIKISGLCGLLMCCLRYENEHYQETARFMPLVGSDVTTPDGKGRVTANDLLRRTVRVEFRTRDGAVESKTYDIQQVSHGKTIADAVQETPDGDVPPIE